MSIVSLDAENPSGLETCLAIPISELQKVWAKACAEKTSIEFDENSLVTRPWIKFSVRFHAGESKLLGNRCGIYVTDFGGTQSVELSFKFWFGNVEGERFCEQPVVKNLFDHEHTGYDWTNSLNALDLFKKMYDENQTVFMFGEIVDLNALENFPRLFIENQWSLYEDKIFDAKVYVGKKRKLFKILKFPFMAQSPVFRAKFSKVKAKKWVIRNMDENTMLNLIKWVYCAQIDLDANVEELLKVAEKYEIELLKFACFDRMATNLTLDNVFLRLSIAEQHNNHGLKEKAAEFVDELPRQELLKYLRSDKWYAFLAANTECASEISTLISNKLNESCV